MAPCGSYGAVREIIFVPYKYQAEQIEAIAHAIVPRLKPR